MKATPRLCAKLIAKRVGPLALALAASGYADATPVSFGTWLTVGDSFSPVTVQAQFTQTSDSVSQGFGTGGQLMASADIAAGTLKALNANSFTSTDGAGTNSLLYDTLTFAGSFSNQPQDFTVHYTGSWAQPTGSFYPGVAPFASGLVRVIDGSTTVDSSVFGSITTLGDFLVSSSAATNCSATPSSNTLLSTGSAQNIGYDVTCQATLNGTDPVLRVLMNLSTGVTPDFNTAGATWSLDMTHTATLDVNFNGLTVYSASGAFPGTQKMSSVPEPDDLVLLATGLFALVRTRKRASPDCA